MHTIRSASPRRVSGALFFGGLVALAVPVFSGAACAPADTLDGGGERTASPDQEALNSIPRYQHKAVCSDAQPGFRRCHARIRTEDDGDTVKNFASPSGLTPAQLKAAYKITGTNTGIVAIVDAQDNPNAESDLAVYRSQFGLPPCTTANG
jgi:subtilase family serine protease